MTISARWSRSGEVKWSARNAASVRLARDLRYGDRTLTLDLEPGEERQGEWLS
jgi:hypothetical protein